MEDYQKEITKKIDKLNKFKNVLILYVMKKGDVNEDMEAWELALYWDGEEFNLVVPHKEYKNLYINNWSFDDTSIDDIIKIARAINNIKI